MLLFIPESQKKPFMKIAVQCPYCQHSLMDKKRLISNVPSIALYCRLPETLGGAQDKVFLSGYCGDYLTKTRLEVPDQTITEFYCPHCEARLTSDNICDECNAPMVELQLQHGGMLELCIESYEKRIPKPPSEKDFGGMMQFCSRRGCKKHRIDFMNPNVDFKEFYDAYSCFIES